MADPVSRKKKIDLFKDGWTRFERAVDVVAKSPPQPKKKMAAAKPNRKKKARL